MKSKWEILGIQETTNQREIKKAFLTKAKEVHPEEQEEAFLELKNAYDSALHESKFKMEYESYLKENQNSMTSQESIKEETETSDKCSNHDNRRSTSDKSKLNFKEMISGYSSLDKLILSDLNSDNIFDDILEISSTVENLTTGDKSDKYLGLHTYFQTLIVPLIYVYLDCVDEVLSIPKLEQEETLLNTLEDQKINLLENIAFFYMILKDFDAYQKLYIDPNIYNDIKFDSDYLFALDKYTYEKDPNLKMKYYQLIMMHELVVYIRQLMENASDSYHLKLSLDIFHIQNDFFHISSSLTIPECSKEEWEILKELTGIDLNSYRVDYNVFMGSAYNKEKLLFPPNYLELQIGIIRNLAIKKVIDPSAQANELEEAILVQFEHWSHNGEDKEVLSIGQCRHRFIQPITYSVLDLAARSCLKDVKIDKYPYVFRLLSEFTETLKPYSKDNKRKPYRWLGAGHIYITLMNALSSYNCVVAAQVYDTFHLDSREYQRLITLDTSTDKAMLPSTLFTFNKKKNMITDLYLHTDNYTPVSGISIKQQQSNRHKDLIKILIMAIVLVSTVKLMFWQQSYNENNIQEVPTPTIEDYAERARIQKNTKDLETRRIDQVQLANELGIIKEYLNATSKISPYDRLGGERVITPVSDQVIDILNVDTRTREDYKRQFDMNPASSEIRVEAKVKMSELINGNVYDIVLLAFENDDYSFISTELREMLGLSEDKFNEIKLLNQKEIPRRIKALCNQYLYA